MSKEVEKVIELLTHWKEFSETGESSLKAFGRWLQENDEIFATVETKNTDVSFRNRYIHSQVPLEDQIVLHWGRLLRFTHLWSKKALKNLPISSTEEFGLLKTVELMGSARKTDLVKFTLLETTTCFEMIKRMVRSGFLREEVDPDDKRSRRVSLTQEGKKLSKRSDVEVKKLSHLLIGNIHKKQKIALLQVLQDLDNFHAKVYERESDQSIDQILEKNITSKK
jgi:DNA-binding MarR family transcriptional regulator